MQEVIPIFIKLSDDMSLSVTVDEPVYRGDVLSKKIKFLVPFHFCDGMTTDQAYFYLSYIRADGTADMMLLERGEDYNELYAQYTLPVTSTMSRYPGQVVMFLTACSGPADHPVIAKSGECVIHILESTNMDEYIPDRTLSMIYQMQKQIEMNLQEKLDNLSYDNLHDRPVTNITGNGIVISSLPDGVYNIIGTWKMTMDDQERNSGSDDLFYVSARNHIVRLTWVSAADGVSMFEVPVDGTADDIRPIDVPTTVDDVVIDGGAISNGDTGG